MSPLRPQFSHCPYSGTKEFMLLTPTHVFLIYPSNILQSKEIYVTCLSQAFWPEFWMGTSNLIFASRGSNISVAMISHLNNQRLHILWWFSLYNFLDSSSTTLYLWSNIFSSNSNICDSLSMIKLHIKVQQKCHYKFFQTHRCVQGNSWIVDITVGYGSYCQWLWFPFFHFLWTIYWELSVRPHGISEKQLWEEVFVIKR